MQTAQKRPARKDIIRKSTELDKLLKALGKFSYKSAGFPAFLLYYNPATDKWTACYRNPKDFENPSIEEKTPVEACRKLIQFMKGKKRNENYNSI